MAFPKYPTIDTQNFMNNEINDVGGHSLRIVNQVNISQPPLTTPSSSPNDFVKSFLATFYAFWRNIAEARSDQHRPENRTREQTVTPLDPEQIDAILAHRSASRVVSGREVYTRLMMRDYGLPMWNPRPDSLPIDRRGGVMPGDVGILTDEGGRFCYLFNIWGDWEALKDLDVPGAREYRPPPPKELRDPTPLLTEMGSLISGADEVSLNHTNSSPRYSDMNYTWRAPEGAVLVTPFGAYTESLKDRSSIEPFIKHNCARLYHLARNRGIRTAPLYIVTGCVKSASWATASYSSEYPQSIVASLQNLARTGPGSGNQFSYRWTSKPSGTDAQTGPNTFSAPLDDRNQNLFISGYRLNALAEEEADSSKDLASVAAHTEPESGHNPGGSSLRHQDQAHGSSPESTSSSHISLGAPSGKGSRYADIDPFPQRRFALPNIGECITNYISSPFAMESIRSSIEKMQHEWRSGIPEDLFDPVVLQGAPGQRAPRFLLLHDDIWLDKWHKLKPQGSNPRSWEIPFMECMWQVKNKTTIVANQDFRDVISIMPSLTPPLTFQEMRQVRIQWCMLSYKHRCADVTLCLHHTAHLAAQSGAVDIPIMCFLLDIRNRCAPNVLLPKLTVGHLFRLLSILVDAQSCPTVAIAVLKELESRQLHPDEVRKHVLRSAALRSILNLPADSLQGESRGPSEDDLSRALQSTNLASGEEKTIKEPGKPLSISVQPNPPVTQPNPIADVKLSPLGDAGLPALLNNVGSSFKSPFEQTGNPSDIDEVIASLERAVELTPPGHAGLPAVLNNLGSSFKSRFERTGNPSDIDEAIASLERAVKLTPPDHADLPGRLNNLGFSFKSRFERTGNPSDSDEAIASLERAVELTPPGHVDLPAFLRNLESSLRHLE